MRVLRYVLFCVFFAIGAGSVALSIMAEEVYSLYSSRTLVERFAEDNEKIKNAMIERQVSMIEEVRRVWQLFRDRRPETYADMSKVLP